MRSVVMLVVGLLAGAFGGSMALRALTAGNEYPHGVMALLRVHHGGLRQALATGTCDAAGAAAHLATLRQVALDIEPAFVPTGSDDAAFSAHARSLRERIAEAEAALGRGCPALTQATKAIGEACKACHRDFRG